jgi:hypothetical protein
MYSDADLFLMTAHTIHRTGDTICCPKCGKQWDVNDPEPPECGDRVTLDARLPGRTTRRRAAYLKLIDQLYGVTPK